MENSTSLEHSHDKTVQTLFCAAGSSGNHKLLLSIANFSFSITALLGNTLILIALHKESSLHPPSKLLYRCLAVTDLFVGLISGPSSALFSLSRFIEREGTRWMKICFYSAGIATVSFTILSTVSVLTLTAISVDRLLALLLGLRYRQILTLTRVRVLVICFWIPSIAFASMSFYKYTIAKSYSYILILLCLLVSALCYSTIYVSIRRYQIQLQNRYVRPNGREIPLNIARYKKTVSSAFWVMLVLVSCYLPYTIVIAIITIQGSSPILQSAWGFTSTLIYFHSTLNPFVYCWKIREVRREVKNTIRQLFCF
ncbi:melanocyte-stimulating hormone receptor-like [Oculina patagonica]